jgi:hypothetical protein
MRIWINDLSLENLSYENTKVLHRGKLILQSFSSDVCTGSNNAVDIGSFLKKGKNKSKKSVK